MKETDAAPEPLKDARSKDDCYGMLFKYLCLSSDLLT